MGVISASLAKVKSVFGRTGDVLAQSGDYSADLITNTPSGDISSTDVQAAINELDSEKAPVDHTHPLSDLEQSSATSGQVVTWNGTSWVPSTPTSGVTDHTLLSNIGVNTHAQIDSHIADMSNPHNVTAIQAGADPTGTAAGLIAAHEAASDPHPNYALESSLATVATSGSHLDLSNIGTNTHADIDAHIDDTVSNPHNVTFTQVGAASSAVTISTTAPLQGGGDLTTNRTLSIANSGVTAGTYTNSTITVNALGLVTSASSGAGGTSLWTDAGTVTYLTSTTDDVAIGSTSAIPTVPPFFMDVSEARLYLNGGVAGSQLDVSGGSYYATALPNTDRHGQINIGHFAAFQGRIHYEGNVEKKLFIENSAVSSIKIRNNTNATAVDIAEFSSTGISTPLSLTVTGVSNLNSLVTAQDLTQRQAVFKGWADVDSTSTTQNGMISLGGTSAFCAHIQYDGSARKLYIDNSNSSLSAADTIFRTSTSTTPIETVRIRGLGQLGVNNPVATGMIDVQSNSISTVTGIFRYFLNQSVNVIEVKNSSGTNKFSIDVDGKMFAGLAGTHKAYHYVKVSDNQTLASPLTSTPFIIHENAQTAGYFGMSTTPRLYYIQHQHISTANSFYDMAIQPLGGKLFIGTDAAIGLSTISMAGRAHIQSNSTLGNGQFSLILENQATNSSGLKITSGAIGGYFLQAYDTSSVLKFQIASAVSLLESSFLIRKNLRIGANAETSITDGVWLSSGHSTSKGFHVSDATPGAYIASIFNDDTNAHGLLLKAGGTNSSLMRLQTSAGVDQFWVRNSQGTTIGNSGVANFLSNAELFVISSNNTGYKTCVLRQMASQTGDSLQWQDSSGAVQMAVAANGRDFILDTTTGTKIGTSTTQKLAFFNKTPIVQQTGGAATATMVYTATEQAMLQKAYDCLRNFGLLS